VSFLKTDKKTDKADFMAKVMPVAQVMQVA
jgi:hypothetical protein